MKEFVSLGLYREIAFGKRVVRIKKLNIRELIEISVLINVFNLSGAGWQAIAEIAITGKVRRRERTEVVRQIIDFNKGDGKNTGKADDSWLQQAVVYFGREFGWTKDDVLNLYPEEVGLLIEENRKLKENEEDYQLIRLIGAYHTPDRMLKSMQKKETGLPDAKMDKDAIERLKNNQKGVSQWQ